jgi:hypothetical protein
VPVGLSLGVGVQTPTPTRSPSRTLAAVTVRYGPSRAAGAASRPAAAACTDSEAAGRRGGWPGTLNFYLKVEALKPHCGGWASVGVRQLKQYSLAVLTVP